MLALAIWCICAVAPVPAAAFCSYRGEMYAKTTVAQERRDAKWVVKARIVSADYHWADVGASWTVYQLRVVTRFKGPPGRIVRLFTYRDSGGFYLDGNNASPGLGTDYLLFLVPSTQTLPRGIGTVTQVNYACGQSRRWSELSRADRAALGPAAR